MKAKINDWGNSHGLRITAPMLDHLKVTSGEEVDIKLTDKGIEIIKKAPTIEYAETATQQAIDEVLAGTTPVQLVTDPYAESEVGYLVITIIPSKPIIREVPKDTLHCYPTLADAKESARQAIQTTIAEAQASMTEIRQIGVEKIGYISL